MMQHDAVDLPCANCGRAHERIMMVWHHRRDGPPEPEPVVLACPDQS
jgi:hypothetical protein